MTQQNLGSYDWGEPHCLVMPVYKQAKDESQEPGDAPEIDDLDYEGTTFTVTDGNFSRRV